HYKTGKPIKAKVPATRQGKIDYMLSLWSHGIDVYIKKRGKGKNAESSLLKKIKSRHMDG
ncbi:MAG: hypothetical protein KAS04_04580, partial [Candidatus Aenigmarchaeota archaeon]|nr:hypothetical protein [Candidatus Aenigmarchaeota archaeon]